MKKLSRLYAALVYIFLKAQDGVSLSDYGVKLESRQPYASSEARLYIVLLTYNIKEAL